MVAVADIFAHYVLRSVATFEQTPPTADDWHAKATALTSGGWPFLVIEDEPGGQLVGFACAGPWRPRPAYRYTVEDTIYLHPAWTGKGLGRVMLAALLERCAEVGARQVIAVIADDPAEPGVTASEALHRAAGFAVVGRLSRVGFKHDRWLDTLLMQRELPEV
jgi:phosphinothricin acetyltransferase